MTIERVDFRTGTFYLGDCFDVMATLPSGAVDMCVTSPPYDNLREYNGMPAFTMDVFKPIAKQLSKCVKSGGVIVWNVADATIDGSETGTSFRQALYFKDECGFRIHDTMIWNKPNYMPKPSNRYEQSFEYVFILSKGAPENVSLIKDKPNVSVGRKLSGNLASKFSRVPLHGSGKVVSEFGTRPNVWDLNTQNGKHGADHPAPFPVQLAQDHIVSWSKTGDVVLDPFGGSGTTAVAAIQSGRRWICIERDQTYFERAIGRVWEAEQIDPAVNL